MICNYIDGKKEEGYIKYYEDIMKYIFNIYLIYMTRIKIEIINIKRTFIFLIYIKLIFIYTYIHNNDRKKEWYYSSIL